MVRLGLDQKYWRYSDDGETIVILPSWFKRAQNFALTLFLMLLASLGTKELFISLFVNWRASNVSFSDIFFFFFMWASVAIFVISTTSKVLLGSKSLTYSSWLLNFSIPWECFVGIGKASLWYYPFTSVVVTTKNQKIRKMWFTTVQFSKPQVEKIYDVLMQNMLKNAKAGNQRY